MDYYIFSPTKATLGQMSVTKWGLIELKRGGMGVQEEEGVELVLAIGLNVSSSTYGTVTDRLKARRIHVIMDHLIEVSLLLPLATTANVYV